MKPEPQQILADSGCLNPVKMPDGRIACVMPLLYTAAIIILQESEAEHFYDDRWCYTSIEAAKQALAVWHQTPGAIEPEGWHRHPLSGRRRKLGDPLLEFIHL